MVIVTSNFNSIAQQQYFIFKPCRNTCFYNLIFIYFSKHILNAFLTDKVDNLRAIVFYKCRIT
jgi:hypothetical protein